MPTSQLTLDAYSEEATAWADSVYQTLDQRGRVAQLMMPHINADDGAASKALIHRLVTQEGVGGLLYSEGSAESYVTMNAYAQSIADVPLLMALDGEWGAAMRIPQAPRYPYNMTLGAIADPGLLYDYGREMARQCHLLGIHANFAPVLDVNSNPRNPVIGHRSFGEDPQRVAQLGVAYSLGLEDGGVMAVGKHFPGHGDTDVDSHKSLPSINHSLDTLHSIDLKPFRDFIASCCSGIMVGHISVPMLDPAGAPASMSPAITQGCLKDDMGFKGLVFTDGLGMQGANVKGNKCVQALIAGCDILLSPPNVHSDIDAVLQAIADGRISEADIEQRCKKVLAYKYVLCRGEEPLAQQNLSSETLDLLGKNLSSETLDLLDASNIVDELNAPSAQTVNQRLCDASIVAVRNDGGLLPLGNLAHNKIAVVSIGEGVDNEFSRLCRKYAPVDLYDIGDLTDNRLADISSHDVVVAAVFADNANTRSALSTVAKHSRVFVPVMMLNPYKTAKFATSLQSAPALLIAGGDSPLLRQSAAKALFGGISVDGRLPVKVDGVAPLGAGVSYTKSRLGYSTPSAAGLNPRLSFQIDSVVGVALKAGAFPGCQVLVAKNGEVIFEKAYGLTTKGGKKVTENTLYDLASVSKTVGTLPGIMKLYDLQRLDLDAPASAVIKQLDVEGKRDITPRMLLYHETGFAPSLSMYEVMVDPDSYDGKLLTKRPDKKHRIRIYDSMYGHNAGRLRTDIASKTRTEQCEVEAAKDVWVGHHTYDTIMARIYANPVKPTRKYLYSCLNFCTLMDLEQRITGMPHERWVADSVWLPIGAEFCYRPTANRSNAQIAATEKDTYLRKQHLQGYVHDELAAFSGGVQGNAGVFGTAADVAKLCQLWLNGGTYGDVQVYTPETCRLFTEEKSPNSRRGLGFDKPDVDNPENSPTCDEASPSTYGHTGYTGTVFWVDPEEELIFVFLCNRVDPTRSNPAFTKSLIRPKLMSLIYQAIKN